MKKVLIALIAVLFTFTLAYGKTAGHKKTGKAPKAAAQTKKTQPKSQPGAKAAPQEPYKAFLVMDVRNGRILESENEHLKRAPASVVKLMVAYVVLEKLARNEIKLTDPITISRESAQMGGSQVYLAPGETFSLEELMKALMVASANDAAYAIAEHLAGSKEAFVQLMNQKAKELSMADTEFHSVHGLPPSKGEAGDLSSCYDLALLGRALLKYPKILEWTSIKTEGFRGGKLTMNNHNKLLFRMPEVDGLKTGFFRETGFNIVATARKNDLRLIVVVLGSPTAKIRDNLALEKFKKTFAQYKKLDLAKKGETINQEVLLPDGETGRIKGVAAADFTCSVPLDQKSPVVREVQLPAQIAGPVKAGQKLGSLLFKSDNQIIGQVAIIAPVDVPEAGFFKKLMRKIGLGS
jgi:serine-type D-Ala-D-Ala carboxypeptidase (penicillin-binding protein 5/6)